MRRRRERAILAALRGRFRVQGSESLTLAVHTSHPRLVPCASKPFSIVCASAASDRPMWQPSDGAPTPGCQLAAARGPWRGGPAGSGGADRRAHPQYTLSFSNPLTREWIPKVSLRLHSLTLYLTSHLLPFLYLLFRRPFTPTPFFLEAFSSGLRLTAASLPLYLHPFPKQLYNAPKYLHRTR